MFGEDINDNTNDPVPRLRRLNISGQANESRGGRILKNTLKASAAVVVIGLGPENPITDIIAGGILIGGGTYAIGTIIYDHINGNSLSATDASVSSNTEKDPTSRRVGPRKSTKEKVKEQQPKNKKGEMLDPNTGKPLDPKSTDLGHKSGSEWRTRKKMQQQQGSTRKQVIEAENNPDLYQCEDRKENRSHRHE